MNIIELAITLVRWQHRYSSKIKQHEHKGKHDYKPQLESKQSTGIVKWAVCESVSDKNIH